MGIRTLIEKKKREQKKREQKKVAKAVAVTAVVGTALGAASGVLFAPKSGKETREDIRTKVDETTGQVKEKINTKVASGKANIDEAKSKIKEYMKNKKAKELVEEESVQEVEETKEEVISE